MLKHFNSVFFLGFKLKDFLNDNETLSTFLLQNASITDNVVQEILMAEVNLEKVSSETKTRANSKLIWSQFSHYIAIYYL